jgi:hypothetical protein
MPGAVAPRRRRAEYHRTESFTERIPSPTEPQMTGILHATELAHFASMAAFAGLAVTLILGCFIIRFGPARRRAIADRRRHQTEAVVAPVPPRTEHPWRH